MQSLNKQDLKPYQTIFQTEAGSSLPRIFLYSLKIFRQHSTNIYLHVFVCIIWPHLLQFWHATAGVLMTVLISTGLGTHRCRLSNERLCKSAVNYSQPVFHFKLLLPRLDFPILRGVLSDSLLLHGACESVRSMHIYKHLFTAGFVCIQGLGLHQKRTRAFRKLASNGNECKE